MPARAERFEALFRAHYPAVPAYALRRAERDVAQDVVAETFLVAWRRLDDVPADVLPWLYGVARASCAPGAAELELLFPNPCRRPPQMAGTAWPGRGVGGAIP